MLTKIKFIHELDKCDFFRYVPNKLVEKQGCDRAIANNSTLGDRHIQT
ncbi:MULTISPECIES: hypothetical protein [unclassified Microcoleus]|nr:MULTISPECIES: hypothetical protein [unclassified Microcoleus]MCC3443251.1 hypothetical protein [Microcoleus sp. PH2017_03_ELD_O_A]MCC3446786.1 hypothetical protein [Microcoleus sp. PH2017_09_SFU_O_A]MCC3466656.1 hypothetical protein [Microcoleus sp. PH2017_06_SFM_O_A]